MEALLGAYSPEAAAFLDDLKRSDSSNNYCLECISYGAFICVPCSGLHRGLGVHLSVVRSSTLDSWTPEQCALMKAGGNAKCQKFFQELGLWDLPLKQRYATRGAAYYRDMLVALSKDLTFTRPPLSPEEARVAEEWTSRSNSMKQGVQSLGSSGSLKAEPSEEGFISTLQQQATAAADVALERVSSFVRGAKSYTAQTFEGEDSILEKAKGTFQSSGAWIAEQSKKLASQISAVASPEETAATETSSQKTGVQNAEEEPKATSENAEVEGEGGIMQAVITRAKTLGKALSASTSQDDGVLAKAKETLSEVRDNFSK